MFQERLADVEFTPAAWPSTLETLVLAERIVGSESPSEPPARTPAASDVPAGVGGLLVSAYVALVLTLFLFFTGSALAAMVVAIAAGFIAIFFAIPRIFFALEPGSERRPDLGRFLYDGLQTFTGHCGGRDALVQMLIVPILLTLGLIAMGIVGAIYL